MNQHDPHVGDKLTFRPSCFTHTGDAQYGARLHGIVIYVNEAHRYYTVEAPCFGYIIRESFKY